MGNEQNSDNCCDETLGRRYLTRTGTSVAVAGFMRQHYRAILLAAPDTPLTTAHGRSHHELQRAAVHSRATASTTPVFPTERCSAGGALGGLGGCRICRSGNCGVVALLELTVVLALESFGGFGGLIILGILAYGLKFWIPQAGICHHAG